MVDITRAPLPPHPGVRDSSIVTSYYCSANIFPTNATAAVTADLLICQLFFMPGQFVDRVGINVTTGAAGACRLGLYTNSAAVVPGTLIADYGTVDTTNIAVVEATISQTFPNAWVWACAVFNATPTVTVGVGNNSYLLGNNVVNGSMRLGLHGAFTYGALPAAAPTMTNMSTVAPMIFFRKT